MSDKIVVLYFNRSSETTPADAEAIAILEAKGYSVAQRNSQYVHEADDKEPCAHIAGHLNERILAVYAGVEAIDSEAPAPAPTDTGSAPQGEAQGSVSQFQAPEPQQQPGGSGWGSVTPQAPANSPAWKPNTPNNPA